MVSTRLYLSIEILNLSIHVQNTNYEAFNTLFTTPKNWVAYYM